MQNHPFSVGFIASAACKAAEAYQLLSDEIALELKARGINVYNAFRPILQPSSVPDRQPIELTFYDYFSQVPSSVVDADVYIVMPNDMSLMSALLRILTHEENKERKSLIILTPRDPWDELLRWLNEVALKRQMISSESVKRINLVEGTEAIITLILRFREQRSDLNA